METHFAKEQAIQGRLDLSENLGVASPKRDRNQLLR